jgi:hypothetical protein
MVVVVCQQGGHPGRLCSMRQRLVREPRFNVLRGADARHGLSEHTHVKRNGSLVRALLMEGLTRPASSASDAFTNLRARRKVSRTLSQCLSPAIVEEMRRRLVVANRRSRGMSCEEDWLVKQETETRNGNEGGEKKRTRWIERSWDGPMVKSPYFADGTGGWTWRVRPSRLCHVAGGSIGRQTTTAGGAAPASPAIAPLFCRFQRPKPPTTAAGLQCSAHCSALSVRRPLVIAVPRVCALTSTSCQVWEDGDQAAQYLQEYGIALAPDTITTASA